MTLTLCPGVGCESAPNCERHIRYRRRRDYPHAEVYPVTRQPGKSVRIQECVEGVSLPPRYEWQCREFFEREAPQP